MDFIIEKMIKDYEEEGLFHGSVSENVIKKAESELSVKFSKEYREYIKNYGGGGIGWVDIKGVVPENAPYNNGDEDEPVVQITKRMWNLGLDPIYYVILNADEFVYCMKSAEKADGRVYNWCPYDPVFLVEADTFYEFLKEEFQEVIDNL